jgi:hypothetical protein
MSATKGKISEFFDFDALVAEKQKANDIIADFIATVNKGATIKIKLDGATGSAGVTKGYDDMAAASQRATDAGKRFEAQQIKISAEVTKAQVAQRLANQQRTADFKQEIISNESAVGSYNQMNAQLKQLSAQYRALSEAERNTTEGKTLQTDILDKSTLLKKLDGDMGNYQRNVGNYSSAFTGFALTLRGLRGPTKLLGEALGIGAQEADQLRLIIEHSFQALSALFKKKEANAAASAEEAAATAASTAAEQAHTVATEEDAAAIAARTTTFNTGNFSTETSTTVTNINTLSTEGAAIAQTELAVATTASSVAFRVFRAAMLLTGIGVVIALIVGAVAAYKALKKANEEANLVATLTTQVNEDAAKSSGKEIGSLIVLKTQIENTLIPMDKRLQAVKDLKDQFPELLKNTTDEALLNGKAADSYDKLTESIIKNARAEAAKSKIQELVSSNVDIQLKGELEAAETKKKIAKSKDDVAISSGGSAPGIGGNLGGTSAAAKQRKLAEDYQKAMEEYATAIRKNNQSIGILLSFVEVGPDVKTDKTGKAKSDKQLQALKDKLDAEFELYKISQEAKLRLFDHDIKSSDVYYLDKLTALDNYIQGSKELIDKQEAYDIETKKREAERQVQRLNEEKVGKSGAQVNRINQNIKITEENLQQEILVIQAKAADKTIALAETTADTRQKILDDYLKKEQEIYTENAKFEKEIIDKTTAAFKKGLAERLKAEEEAEKKRLELKKEIASRQVELENKTEDLIFSIAKASTERALNNLQDKRDANDANTAREIELVNASADTAEKKAARIALIDAKSAATKANLDKQSRDLKVKEAKFEQAKELFDITIGVIKAVAAIKAQVAVLSSNPLTIGFAPLALAQIPFVIGTGIASAAAVLATPIPKYKDGTKNTHPGGLAWVGDGFKKELTVGPDGTMGITPDRPTLMNLPKGTSVFPDADKTIKAMMMYHMRAVLSAGNKTDTVGQPFPIDHFDKTMSNGFSSVVKAINNKTTGTPRGRIGYDIMFGTSEADYLNKNLRS